MSVNVVRALARPAQLPWRALAGPALAGACLGLEVGLDGVVLWAVTLPGLFLSVTVLGLPALYIAMNLTGDAPPLSDVATRAVRALEDAGTVLLGLSPALGFLVLTTLEPDTVLLLGLAVVSLAALLALRSLFYGLFGPAGATAKLSPIGLTVYVCWSLVALCIGCTWFLSRALQTLGGGA